eukprot:scaffold4.g4578.t1
MADLRSFVTGQDACGPSDGAGPSNAAASLADALLGRGAKQQAQLRELPGVHAPAGPGLRPYVPPTAAAAAEAALAGELPAVAGLAPPGALQADVEAFLRGGGPAAAPSDHLLHEFESIYGAAGGAAGPVPPGMMPPASSAALAPFLRVSKLLASLGVDPRVLPAGAPPGAAAWDDIFAAATPRGLAAPSPATDHAASAAMAAAAPPQWVQEFGELRLRGAGGAPAAGWADEYEQQQVQGPDAWARKFESDEAAGGAGWADEFAAAAAVGSAARAAAAGSGDALEQTRRLADTLAANKDPKFQNSKFLQARMGTPPHPCLQFLSKMSRGEYILEDNQVKEVPAKAAAWAQEFEKAAQRQPGPLGEERAPFQARALLEGGPANREFEAAQAAGGRGDWADEFASGLAGGGEWAEQFAAGEGAGVQQWEEEYLSELERLHSAAGPRAAGEYVMAENNPFLLDTDSFAKGKDLFRRGVLTEAVLALEAECQRNPGNAEAWRLLGTVQAENDDDQQAIAAMNRALAADPSNLDVLLSLGVSHTNELEQARRGAGARGRGEAASYLRQWVLRHPRYGPAAAAVPQPPDSSQSLSYTTRLFEQAAAAHPEDADLHTALGVVHNLSRNYDAAVAAFRAALALHPQARSVCRWHINDYSLWNKLGATLANSSHSAEAALDLKPNYMRAWTNMGISQANLADYEASARFYVRALALNPRASAVWGYLRTSVACAGRADLMDAVDREDLVALQAALPL